MDSQGRSLSSGVSIPQWMKSKMNDRLDFDQSAFSPTELDDTFMYLSRKTVQQQQQQQSQLQTKSISKEIEKHDFSKLPTPCQKFIQNPQANGAQEVLIGQSSKKLKSCGVDDGFKGEAAQCGSSIIRVANQMVSGKVIRGFDVHPDNYDPQLEGFNPARRRGSKSLPASPLASPNTSPKLKRRNKYFTSAFVDTESGHKEGWIMSNLLAKREALSQSLDVINEKDQVAIKRGLSTLAMAAADMPSSSKGNVLNPKPSELREMNFWSPTSM